MKQEIITIHKNGEKLMNVPLDIYVRLFEHTVVRRRIPYLRSLEDKRINLEEFIKLTRTAEVPYPLFLCTKEYVEKMINEYEAKVFYGVHKTNLSLSSRGDVELADISLILKDLTRKQGLLRSSIQENNALTNVFKKSKKSPMELANELRLLLGYDIESVSLQGKEHTFSYLRDLLGEHNIYVSLYMHNYCPQLIPKNLNFSGICINDKKCPFIFIRAGDDDSSVEPWGRRVFTCALLLSCMTTGKFGAVTLSGRSRDLIKDRQYEIAEEFLMPSRTLEKCFIRKLDDIEELARQYSVSPSAMVMRLFRLKHIEDYEKETFFDELIDKYNKALRKKGGGNPPKIEKAITQYNSPKLVRIVLSEFQGGGMSERDVRNVLYYKKGESFNIEALNSYVGI